LTDAEMEQRFDGLERYLQVLVEKISGKLIEDRGTEEGRKQCALVEEVCR